MQHDSENAENVGLAEANFVTNPAYTGPLSVPMSSLSSTAPKEGLLDSEKDVEWYCQYNRYFSTHFHNQQMMPVNLFTGDQNIISKNIGEEAYDSWAFVLACQTNNRFKFAETDFSGKALTAVFVPGKEIYSLFKQVKGRILDNILSFAIEGFNWSADFVNSKGKLISALEVQPELDKAFADVDTGVRFTPDGKKPEEFDIPEDIKNYVDNLKDLYTIIAEEIGLAAYERDFLPEKFLQAGSHAFVDGVVGMFTKLGNNFQAENTVVPVYDLIWDHRQDDEQNRKGQVFGWLERNIPLSKILKDWRHKLSNQEIRELEALIQGGDEKQDEFISYYDCSPNMSWFSNESNYLGGTISHVYFVSDRDFRYQDTKNKWGRKRINRISDKAQIPTEQGMKDGKDVRGDYWGLDVHYVVVACNKYVLDYGYAEQTVRPNGREEYPELPGRVFIPDMIMSTSRSHVSYLKDSQMELDRLALIIMKKTIDDHGKKHIFNGSMMDDGELEIMNFLTRFGIYVADGTSGEQDDDDDKKPLAKMVETVDMTLDPNIIRYIELKREQKQMMQEIVSTSLIDQGQQGTTVGARVQQGTIKQNSYGMASFYQGLVNFYQNVLNYNLNLVQKAYQYTDGINELVDIGKFGSEFLKKVDPGEFGSKYLGLLLKVSNTTDPERLERLRSLGLANAQNDKLDFIDFIKHVDLAKSSTQMVKGLEYSTKKQRSLKMKEQQMASQMQGGLEQNSIMLKAELEQMKEIHNDFRTMFASLTELKGKLINSAAGSNVEQPEVPVTPLEQEIVANLQEQPVS